MTPEAVKAPAISLILDEATAVNPAQVQAGEG
jgi:hypothetical protein